MLQLYFVVITKMQTGEETVKEFTTAKDAINYFCEWCDEHNYTHEWGEIEAGGIGHDYRIEIKNSIK